MSEQNSTSAWLTVGVAGLRWPKGPSGEFELPYTVEDLVGHLGELLRREGFKGDCYIRPLAFRGYGEMGLFAQSAPVDVIIAVWPWGAYLGEEGKKKGVRAKVSSWRRISPSGLIPHAKASGQYLNSILAKIESHKAGYEEAILLDDQRQQARRARFYGAWAEVCLKIAKTKRAL